MSCKCGQHYTNVWQRWRVLKRAESRTKASLLMCLDCRWEWKSTARYVVLLPDHNKRLRPKLDDAYVLELVQQGFYRVDVDKAQVFSRNGKEIAPVVRVHPKGTQCGTYRFVRLNHKGGQRSIALHRLVWMVAHNRVVPEGYDVDHRDNQEDDTITNLRLLTSSYNRALGADKANSNNKAKNEEPTADEDDGEVPF